MTKDKWIEKIDKIDKTTMYELDYLEIDGIIIKDKGVADKEKRTIPINVFLYEITHKGLSGMKGKKLIVRSDMFARLKATREIGTIERIDEGKKSFYINNNGFTSWLYKDEFDIIYKTGNKLRIGVDQDWVLAKLTKKWLEYYNAIFDDDLKANDLESWDITEKVKPEAKNVMLNILNIPEFYRDLEVTKDSQRVLKNLQEQGHEIFIVTDPYTKMSMTSKFEWLQEHFGFIDKKHYIFTASKGVIDLDILIDDGVHNCEVFKGKPILFDTPYNQKENRFLKARNWQDIENIFEHRLEELLGGV